MKTVKFLTLFAMASLFVACVDDLTPTDDIKQDMNDVVRGEVIGTDVSMSIPVPGVQTKYTDGVQGWDSSDRVGLGWLYQGDEDLASSDSKLYANHLFYVNEEGDFETRGNIYKGWHFAYFPYTYMETIGSLSGVDLNPAQTVNIITDSKNYQKRLGQAFSISALQFLTKESLEEPNYDKIRSEVSFVPHRAVSLLNLDINPAEGSAFAEDEGLGACTITKVTVNINYKRFADKVDVIPSKLHQYDTEMTPDENAAELLKSFPNALKPSSGEYGSSITTNVGEAGYTVGNRAAVVAFTLPYMKETETIIPNNKPTVVVTTNVGKFTIGYVTETEETPEWQLKNNAALKALAEAYSKDGIMTLPGQHNLMMTLYLHENNFTNDWSVSSYDEWTAKVDLAKSLNREDVTFELKSDVVFPAGEMYVGADAEGEGALDITVNVTGDKKFYLTFTGETTWSPNVTLTGKASVKVAETGKLILNDNLNVYGVYNEGVIDAKNNITNSNGVENYGTINVALNSQIPSIQNKNEGKVVYTVVGTETAEKIDNLVSPDTGVRGQLTNLVVNSDWTVEGAANWPALALELNNADVTFAAGASYKSITVTGESTITGNVTVTGDVFVVEGATLTVDGDINGNVNVFGTATINATKISGDLLITERAKEGEVKPSVTLQSPYGVMTISDITNYATLNVETDVYAANVKTGSDSYTEIKTGFTLYYSGSKVQDGTVKGKLEAGRIDSGVGYEKIGDVFFVNAETGLNAAFTALTAEDIKPTIVLQAPVTLTASNLGGVAANEVITIDANGNEITFGKTNDLCVTSVAEGVKLVINDATVNKANIAPIPNHGEELVFDCEVEFNNVTFTTNLQLRMDAVLNDVRIYPEADVYALYTPNYGQNIELNDCEIKGTRGIKICEVGFDSLGYEEGKVTYSINNTIFETTGKKAAVLVRTAEGADIYWNVNNNIEKVAADTKLPVWLDSEAPSSYTNAVNVYKVDGENVDLDNTLRGFEN